MIEKPKPLLVHDTTRVLYANELACALFGCDLLTLSARQVVELVIADEFRKLIDVHMRILRERGSSPDIEYPFLRCDMTVFYAKTYSVRLEQDLFSMALTKTFEWW